MTSGPGAGEQTVSVKTSDISKLRSRLDDLAAGLGAPAEPGYLEAAAQLVESAIGLVGAEERIRERKRATRRRLNRFRCIVTNVWLGLECLTLGVGVALGTYSTFWLLLLVPVLLCAMAIAIMVRDPKLEFRYSSFWPGVLLATSTYASLEFVVNHLIPGGFTALVVLLAVCTFGTFEPVTFTRPESKDTGSDVEVHDAIPEAREAAEPSDAAVPEAAVDPNEAVLAKHVQALESRVASLSSAMARAGLAPQADLDVVDAQDSGLVAQVVRGRAARNGLLSVPERTARLAVLTGSAQANLDRLDTVASAVETAKVLGRTRARDKSYKQAAADLLEASGEVERVNVRCENLANRAARCADELKADDKAAAEIADVLGAGELAYRQLLAKAHARLRDEVERGSVLPGWFIPAFGLTPPGVAEPWYDAAARVIAYRVVYGVRAGDSPLGPRPLGSEDHTGLTQYDDLQEVLRSRSWAR